MRIDDVVIISPLVAGFIGIIIFLLIAGMLVLNNLVPAKLLLYVAREKFKGVFGPNNI